MAKVSNFQINTHYTGLGQLNQSFTGSLNVSSRSIGFVLGQLLAETTITIPAGIYVDACLIYNSIENKNRLTHGNTIVLSSNPYVTVYLSLNRNTSTTYRFAAYATNTGSSNYTIPSFTANAWIKLLTSPFGA